MSIFKSPAFRKPIDAFVRIEGLVDNIYGIAAVGALISVLIGGAVMRLTADDVAAVELAEREAAVEQAERDLRVAQEEQRLSGYADGGYADDGWASADDADGGWGADAR